MSKPPRFPATPGSCQCELVTFRLETSPLFCFACHCTDCQKETGSAFTVTAQIEADLVTVTSPTRPRIVVNKKPDGQWKSIAECPKCRSPIWRGGSWRPGILNVSVGCMYSPNFFPPDAHCYIRNKLNWIQIPADSNMSEGYYDPDKLWPKISHKRAEAFKKRYDASVAEGKCYFEGEDKTPTTKTPTAEERAKLNDEEFEKHYDEREQELQRRLEELTLKLSGKEPPAKEPSVKEVVPEKKTDEEKASKEEATTTS